MGRDPAGDAVRPPSGILGQADGGPVDVGQADGRQADGGQSDGSDAQLTQADYEHLAAFRHALRRFVNFSTEAARLAGLTTQQHQALLAIKGHRGGTLTIGALAETLLIAPHTAAELVTRLEASRLVARVPDPADRRRVGLQLTQQADEALRKLSLIHLREVKVLAPRLMGIFRDLDAQFG